MHECPEFGGPCGIHSNIRDPDDQEVKVSVTEILSPKNHWTAKHRGTALIACQRCGKSKKHNQEIKEKP